MVARCPICDLRPAKPGQICVTCRSTLGGVPVQQAIEQAVRAREEVARVAAEVAARETAAREAVLRAQAPAPPAPAPTTVTVAAPLSPEPELTVDEALADLEKTAADGAPAHRLGDKIAVVAKAFGFVQTPGCGCQQRQENLNYVNFNQSPVQVAKDIWSALRAKKEPKAT